MERKKYAVLEKKIEDLESKLIPILSIPSPEPETPPFHRPITDGINQQLLFIDNLLSTEIALSPAPSEPHRFHLGQIARRVRLLQSTFRSWAEARPVLADPGSGSSFSWPESCVVDEEDDDDHGVKEGEELGVAGFRVYDNPEFVHSDVGEVEEEIDLIDYQVEQSEVKTEDYDDQKEQSVEKTVDYDDQNEQSEEKTEDYDDQAEEFDGANEDEDKMIDFDCLAQCKINKTEDYDEDEDEDEIMMIEFDNDEEKSRGKTEDYDEQSEYNCCFRVIYWVIMMFMWFTFVMICLSDYSEPYPSEILLTPT